MNHVTMTSTTESDLRASQLADTRQRIAQATIDVMLREGPAALTFPAVAEQAGVSLRTVYRHFPNKEDLVLAAVHVGAERTKQIFPTGTVSVSQMREFLPVLWTELEAQRDLVNVQHAAPAGIAVRRERLRTRTDEVRESITRDYPEIPAADVDRLAQLVTVMIGSSLMFDLVDHLGVDVAEAADLSAYAIQAVVERARREGGIR